LVPPTDIVGPADGVHVWDYLAENIDDFAVAKAIADHFDAFPMALESMPDMDLLGLYLRAKVTIKRSQIAFAECRRVEEALASKPGGLGRLLTRAKSFARLLNGLRLATQSNPTPALGVVLVVCAWWMR